MKNTKSFGHFLSSQKQKEKPVFFVYFDSFLMAPGAAPNKNTHAQTATLRPASGPGLRTYNRRLLVRQRPKGALTQISRGDDVWHSETSEGVNVVNNFELLPISHVPAIHGRQKQPS